MQILDVKMIGNAQERYSLLISDGVSADGWLFSPLVLLKSILDVIGIVTSTNPSIPVLRKNGMEIQRRVHNLKDASGRSVEEL